MAEDKGNERSKRFVIESEEGITSEFKNDKKEEAKDDDKKKEGKGSVKK